MLVFNRGSDVGRNALSFGAVAILHAIATGSQFGFDIMNATGLTSGTVYPTLDRLEHAGLLKSHWESEVQAHGEGRPARRYFKLTAAGADSVTRRARETPHAAAGSHRPYGARVERVVTSRTPLSAARFRACLDRSLRGCCAPVLQRRTTLARISGAPISGTTGSWLSREPLPFSARAHGASSRRAAAVPLQPHCAPALPTGVSRCFCTIFDFAWRHDRAASGLHRRRRPDSGPGDRRERHDLQLGGDDSAVAPSRSGRAGPVGRDTRHHAHAQRPELLVPELSGPAQREARRLRGSHCVPPGRR